MNGWRWAMRGLRVLRRRHGRLAAAHAVGECRYGTPREYRGQACRHGDQVKGITVSRSLLALFFVVAGVLHFVFMVNYVSVMPPWLPWHRALVIISGVGEIVGGLGVLWSVTRRWAGYGLIALCVAVLPANVQMLLDAQVAASAACTSTVWLGLLWLRLPLQGLLIFWIWRATRGRAAG